MATCKRQLRSAQANDIFPFHHVLNVANELSFSLHYRHHIRNTVQGESCGSMVEHIVYMKKSTDPVSGISHLKISGRDL